MEEQTSPTMPNEPSLATLVGDIERRRAEVQQQHETHRVRCLVLEDDLKAAVEARNDAAARYNELSLQLNYLHSLAQSAGARPSSSAA